MADDSPGLLVGVLGILKSGNAFVPINPLFPKNRINFIIHDCKIKVLLTDNANYEKAQQIAKSHPLIERLLCIDSTNDNDDTAESESSRDRVSRPMGVDGTCYVIYTSGSTGQPKGVPITHCNLIPLLSWFRDYFGLGTHTRVMQNLSYTFDFGVFELLSTILYGGCLYLSDKRVIGDFSFYSRFINTHFINTVHSTPVFFDNVVSFGEMMHSLRLVHLGGERLTGKIVKDISRVVPGNCKIHNGYGPTEATINCSIFTLTAAQGRTIDDNAGIPIGRPTANNFLYILDRYNNPQSVGVVGELCVAGGGTARGYLNRPQLTAEKFDQDFHHSSLIIHHSSLYRTGDLARWLPDGNIEFLGRIDHQVKVKGYRIELGEIEHCLLAHGDIKEVVVLAREKEDGSHYLCAYIVPENSPGSFGHAHSFTVSELREYLLQQLPDYMIPSYFIQLDRMPLTTNGKIDRKVLPEPDESSIVPGVEYAAPVTDTEKKLANIWQGLLKTGKIGRMDDFFELGGDSILANQCIARIREAFQVEIPLRKFFEQPYIKALSWEIGKQERQAMAIPKAPRDGEIPLSFAQERLWFLHTLDSGSTAYFVPRVIRMRGKLEVGHLEQTFTEIVRRHEILRTTFPIQDDHPVQRIHPPYPFKIPIIDWSKEEEKRQTLEIAQFIKEEGQRPFDFEKGPLLRVTLLRLKKEEHLLVLTEHHLIHDGWTQGVLLKEFIEIFTAYLEGKEHTIPELPIQYADFAIWQRNYLQGEILERHLDYWKEKLSGLGPVLELPTDRPRPPVISGEGAMRAFHLSGRLTLQLKDFSRRNGVTLFMTMLAVFKIFLYRYTGGEDLCVGTGIANRRYKEMEGMLGMVVNTLPLRTHVAGDMTFDQCLHQVKETCLKAYQHEDTPFGKIVEVMQPKRSLSYMPIFQVMFSFMDTPTQELRLPGMELHLEEFHNRSSKFDINLVVVPPQEQAGDQTGGQGDTLIEWEYNTDIFDDETTDRMIKHYTRLLEEIIMKSKEKISALSMLEKPEIEQLLYEFNNTTVEYPSDKVIHELFEEQAERAGDHIALVGVVGQHLTYRPYMTYMTYKELNKKSNRLTHLLMEKGIQPGSIVGIMVERSVEMIIGILGILKAGGTYMPIDPDYPQQRINYMLADSNTGTLLTSQNLSLGTTSEKEIMPLEDHRKPATNPSNSAYIMYTSGSTGHPKGVMVTHRNVIRLVKNANYVPLTVQTRILQTGAPVFDATTFEIWGSLLNGGQLILTGKEVILDAHRLGDALNTFNANTLWLSSPLFNRLMQQDIELFAPLNYLLVGGDVLSPANIDRVRETFPNLKIINGYGPTENTTFSTTYLIDRTFELNIPIGSPISNSTAYIVNTNNHLQPVGVWGELCVGGDGISCGYLNSPEMTAKYFNRSYRSHGSYISYKTGDLARWLSDGNIEFLGRRDFQVKIRGYRVELGEIESQLLNHMDINEAVVIAKEKENNNKYLCAYFTSSKEVDISSLRDHLSKKLPDYMIPTYFTQLEKLPLTVNGKIDQKVLPAPEIKTTDPYIAPRNDLEEKLVQIWSGVLGVEKENIGIDTNFFDIGGHSLNATVLMSRIHKAFDVKIPLGEFFKQGTARELAQYIRNAVKETFNVIQPVETKEYYPLSPSQERIYLLHQMQPWSPAYNISERLMMTHDINEKSVEKILKALVEHHESLRTGFKIIKNNPVQFTAKTCVLPFRFIDISFMEESEKQQKRQELYHQVAFTPFDLETFPLFRSMLVKLGPKQYELLFNLHHIITDGWSMEILKKEFLQLVESFVTGKAVKSEPLHLQYKDFAGWHRDQLTKKGKGENPATRFWKDKLAGGIPFLRLPADFPTAGDEPGGAGYRCTINSELKEALRQLAGRHYTSLFTVMFSIYLVLLSRVSGQEDVGCSVIAAGREHEALQDIVGLFVNSLLFRVHVDDNQPFEDFLREVDTDVMESLRYQGCPMEPVFEELGMRYPRVSVSFNMLNLPGAAGIGKLNPLECHHIDVTQDVKFNLEPYITEYENGIDLRWVYRKSLFKPLTIEYIANLYMELAAFFAQAPCRSLKSCKTGARIVTPGRFKRRKAIEG
jgi:amino acid adenylation domain-containing protein